MIEDYVDKIRSCGISGNKAKALVSLKTHYLDSNLEDSFLKMFGKITPKKMMDLPINDDIKELVRWYKEEYAPFHNSIEKRTDRLDQKEPVSEKVVEKQEDDE